MFDIDDPSIGDLETCDDEKFSKILLDHICKSTDSIWNDKHTSKDFFVDTNNDLANGLCPVTKLTDMFHFELTSDFDI